MYRRSLGNKSQPTIEAYLTDFLRFIAQERPTTRDQETVILLRVANHLFRNVLRSAKKDGSLKTSIKGYRDLFKGMDRSRSMAKVDVENVLSGCRSELNDRIERVFGEFDPTPRMKRSLVTLVGELIQSDAPTPSHSGLVIAGFGEKEFFPTLVAVSVEGVVGGKLKYDRRLQVDIARDGDPAMIVPFAQGEMVTRFMEGIDPTFLVSCPASLWCFRVRHARQCKAWSAGNIGHIGKDHNAAVARMANSRRARPTGPVAALRPLAMGPPFPAGTRLATDPVGRAEIPETCGTRH